MGENSQNLVTLHPANRFLYSNASTFLVSWLCMYMHVNESIYVSCFGARSCFLNRANVNDQTVLC
jgi:hypothetical protein